MGRWRKQILPVGELAHPTEGRFTFDHGVLAGIKSRFAGVPFNLVDEQGRHVEDPARTRGQVVSLDLANDGLDAIIETEPRGDELLADYPQLPVSVRLVRTPEGFVLRHVAGTLDPVAPGMRPWAALPAAGGPTVDFSVAGASWVDLANASPLTRARLDAEAAHRAWIGASSW